ncbi:MAG: hypothetical protein E7305_05580 [Butyrivibrio sp.]|nr:hypothetical protein [Butyrivibrio sp.]
MENKLARLFDYQKFSPNDKLASIIADVESRYQTDIEVLSDDELGMLNAAGSVDALMKRTAEKNSKNAIRSKNGVASKNGVQSKNSLT